jgi:hypothetical protein
MQRLFAIASLTWKAAFRFRLFIVLLALLLASVVALPLLIKDDGTAQGFTQILLTYTLTTITALLGLSTLWLGCGTLARDIEDCQMQVVAVKPIARWQIWLGKWIGIMSLNAALLAITGGALYGLLLWRATKLPADQQAILRREILVSRGSAKEKSFDADIDAQTDRELAERAKKIPLTREELQAVRKEIREQVKAEYQVVAPRYFSRPYEINLGLRKDSLRDRPLQLRFKFNAADKSVSGTFFGVWRAGVPRKTKLFQKEEPSLAPDTFHEIELPPNLFDENGVLTLTFVNVNNTALLIPLEDGVEVLYRQGSFAPNFIRGLVIIFCWLGLLAFIGLASASFLSFPVAAFLSLAVLAVTFSTGTLSSAIENGTILDHTGEGNKTPGAADKMVVTMFQGILWLINVVKEFSPIDSLSTGRSISWEQLGRAILQIIIVIGGLIAVFGISVFNRRELATAQGTQ